MKNPFTRLSELPVKKLSMGTLAALLIYTLAGFLLLPFLIKPVLEEKLSLALTREVTVRKVTSNPFTLSFTIRGVGVSDHDNGAFFSLEELFLNLELSSLLRKAAVIKEVSVKAPYLRIVQLDERNYNFSDLMGSGEKGDSPVFPFSIGEFGVTKGKIEFDDRFRRQSHTIDRLDLSLSLLSSLPKKRERETSGSLGFELDGAPVRISVKAKPFAKTAVARVGIDIKKLSLPLYLPYMPVPKEIELRSADFSTNSEITLLTTGGTATLSTVSGRSTLSRVKLFDKEGEALLFLPEADVTLAPSRPMEGELHLSKVLLDRPHVNIKRLGDGNLNLLSIFEEKEADKTGTGTFTLDHLRITSGKIDYLDLSLPSPFSGELNAVEFTLENFSTIEKSESNFLLSATIGKKEQINIGGNFSLAPFKCRGNLRLTEIQPGEYMPFYEDLTSLTVSGGALDLSTSFLYRDETPSAKTILSNGTVKLTDLMLSERPGMETFLSVPELSIEGIFIDPGEKRITLSEFSSEKGILNLKRSPGGALNLENIIHPSPPEHINEAPLGEQTEIPEKPWHVAVDSLRFTDYTVDWEDLMPSEAAGITLSGMEIRGTGLSTTENKKGNLFLGLDWNGSGSIKAEGALGLSPISAELKIEAGNIGIDSFQPYFTDKVRITVTGGKFGTKGLLSVGMKDDASPMVNFRGKASITDFASIDRPYAHGLLDREPEDFLRWGSLAFSGMDLTFPLLKAGVDEIALSDFYSRIVIYEDGLLNLAAIFSPAPEIPEEQESSREKPRESTPASSIAVNRVTLERGEIDFSDHLQEPGFSTTLKELNGSLSGLSSTKETHALLSLSGTHGNTAPLSIKGKINPLIENPFADISISFKGIELPPFTPYSARYLGYKLHKGKLDLDLGYRLNDNRIAGENKVLFDQFTLGDKVESPLATSLPINLAISLLSDSKGRIHIDLPVRGDLADPEFSFGGMIFKALGNLITKIVTSPFAALGSMFGGGAELSHVEFEYGDDRIVPAMSQRLDKLASALNNRPGLFLEIKGATDGIMDRKSLLEQKFENIIKAVKLEEMVKTGQRTASLSGVEILPDEYEPLVSKAFASSPLPKPLDPLGQPMVLSTDEIKRRIMFHIEVPDGELRELAERRAGAVKEFLSGSRKIAPERLFLLEPDTPFAAEDDEKKGNRVNFSMR